GLGRESEANVEALGRRKVDVLDDDGGRPGVQIDHREGLLGAVDARVELDAKAAVDGQQIAALAVGTGAIGTAHEGDRQRAAGRLARRGVEHQGASGRDGPTLAGRLILDGYISRGGEQRECGNGYYCGRPGEDERAPGGTSAGVGHQSQPPLREEISNLRFQISKAGAVLLW